ncbi:60Kd inner membrane protein-domain-containing protein [Scleroderma citrinum]
MLANGVVSVGIVNARSFWWSKSSASTQATASPSSAPNPPLDASARPYDKETGATPSLTASTDTGHALLVPDTMDTAIPDEASLASEPSVVANIIPPLHHGDFYDLGLAQWWSPAGWVRYSFEVLHVTTGMPWFYVIVAGTMLWRLAATKFTIEATRNASRLRPYAAELRTIDEKAEHADQTAKLEAMLQKKKIMDKTGVSMLSSAGAPLAQVVLQFGVFFGVKKLVTLPVPQLHDSGVWFLPDLTVAGDYYIMPLVVASLANLQLMLQKRDLDISRPEMAHIFNVLRVVGFISSPLMAAYPDGLWLSVAAGLVISVLQTRILQIPGVRAKLGITSITATLPPTSLMDTYRYIRRYIQQKWKESQPQPSFPAQKMIKSKSGKASRK